MFSHCELAQLAKDSYTGTPDVQVDEDVQAFYTKRENEFVVTCPGTHASNIEDWLRDLTIFPDWFPGIGACHEGFGRGGEDLWYKIKSSLPLKESITYTGHSLGGALALVLAALHARDELPSCRVITFGAPKVLFLTNLIFSSLIKDGKEFVEYQRANDPVIPYPGIFYKHPTSGVKIGTPVSGENPIPNHDINLYIQDLKGK